VQCGASSLVLKLVLSVVATAETSAVLLYVWNHKLSLDVRKHADFKMELNVRC
jgi:hypothetical protein